MVDRTNIPTDAEGFEGPDAAPSGSEHIAQPDPNIPGPREDGDPVHPDIQAPDVQAGAKPEAPETDTAPKTDSRGRGNKARSSIADRHAEKRAQTIQPLAEDGDMRDDVLQHGIAATPTTQDDPEKTEAEGAGEEAPTEASTPAPASRTSGMATVKLADGSTIQVPLDSVQVPTKVNGREDVVPATALQETYQKNRAADDKLARAKQILAGAHAPQQNSGAEPNQPGTTPGQNQPDPAHPGSDQDAPPPASQTAPENQRPDREKFKEVVQKIQLSDEEEGAEALAELFESVGTRNPEADFEQVAERVLQDSERRKAVESGFAKVEQQFPGYIEDPTLQPILVRNYHVETVQDMMDGLGLSQQDIQEGLQNFGGNPAAMHHHFANHPDFRGSLRSIEDLMIAGAQRTHDRINELAGVKTNTRDTVPTPPAQTRQERKREVVPQQQPGRRTAGVRTEVESRDVDLTASRSQAVASMRQSRKGHQRRA